MKEQSEVISKYQDMVDTLCDKILDYKKNPCNAVRVMNQLRRHISASVDAGQRELSDQYDDFARVSDFKDSCRSID